MLFDTKSKKRDAAKLLAFDATTSCLMIVDHKNKIIFCNTALLKLLRSTGIAAGKDHHWAESLLGEDLNALLDEPISERQQRIAKDEALPRSVVRDGRIFDLSARSMMVDDRIVGMVVEWSAAADRIEGAERTARLAAIDRAQAIIEFTMDGTILNANPNFLSAMGYTLAEIKGKHHSMFLGAASESREYREFWSGLNRGEFQAGEFKRTGKDGKEVWILATYNPIFDDKGKPVKVVKFAADVTAQKLRTADLSGQIAAINKSQAVVEFAMDGTILNANENFLATLGYNLSEIVGRHHSIFVRQEELNGPDYRRFWASLSNGEYHAGEYQRVGKGNKDVWIQASYNPIFDMNGVPFKVVKYAADTTNQVIIRMKNDRVRLMMESVAAGAEELNASVREISEAMVKSRNTASLAVNKVEVADSQTQKLAIAAQAMSGIVELIGNITGQINLLALNATIESARAGDAGRGFAVVASEVKNLANQAKEATDRITGEISRLNEISADVVAALVAIKKEINTVSEYVTATAVSIKEQSSVTQEMSASMQRAAAEAA